MVILFFLQAIDLIAFADQVDLESGAEDLVDAELAFLRLCCGLSIGNHIDFGLVTDQARLESRGHATRPCASCISSFLALLLVLLRQVRLLLADPLLHVRQN